MKKLITLILVMIMGQHLWAYDFATSGIYYNDKNGKQHFICKVKLCRAVEKMTGVTKTSFRDEKASNIQYYNEPNVDAKESRTYSNGDVITKGDYKIKFRLYTAGKEKVNLAEFPVLNYQDQKLVIKFLFQETMRRFINPDLLAGFIGALAEYSFTNIKCTGSCFVDASCYPSQTHVNGESIDILYSDKHDTNQKLIDALYKFHFKLFYVGLQMKYNHATPKADHNDHIHIGSFNHLKIKNKES